MFNTKAETVLDDGKRKSDVATMRISSFMINNNPQAIISGHPSTTNEFEKPDKSNQIVVNDGTQELKQDVQTNFVSPDGTLET